MVCLKESGGSADADESSNQSREIFYFASLLDFFFFIFVCLDIASRRKVRSPRHKLAKLSPVPRGQSWRQAAGSTHIGCLCVCVCVCVCVCNFSLMDLCWWERRVHSGEGNGSFVFLLILPVDTRVAGLLADLRSAAGEGLLSGLFCALLDDHIYIEEGLQSAPRPLRG